MFLTEDTNTNVRVSNSAADPSDLYEAILEANEVYHDVCMKMVKCEHHCIVNEDTAMLKEAEEEAKKTLKQSAKALLDKILKKIREFGAWLREKVTSIGNALRKIGGAIAGKIRVAKGKLERAVKHSKTVADASHVEDLGAWETMDNVNESVNMLSEAEEAAGEEVDAKSALEKAKAAFANLKKTLLKLNVFGNDAKKAANEGEPEEAHKKVSKIGAILSKVFNALKTAVGVVLGVIVAIAKLPYNAGKKVGTKIGEKINDRRAKKEGVDNGTASASILDLFN